MAASKAPPNIKARKGRELSLNAWKTLIGNNESSNTTPYILLLSTGMYGRFNIALILTDGKTQPSKIDSRIKGITRIVIHLQNLSRRLSKNSSSLGLLSQMIMSRDMLNAMSRGTEITKEQFASVDDAILKPLLIKELYLRG